jgi:hypothetical protein
MRRPIHSTLLLALLAVATSAVAGYFYPWPEVEKVSDKVNQPVFAGFETSQVRSIEITRFNSDRQILERISVTRKGEKWVLPNAANYNANNAAQIARAINSLIDRKVLELISEEQQDHLKNGVIDPDEFQSVESRGGLGKKITLKDRNGQALASLIIGSPLENSQEQSLYCVRITGQPQVYSVQFDINALTTRFQDWVDPNLMRLRTQEFPNGQPVKSVTIDSYRIEPTKLAEEAVRVNLYQAVLAPFENQIGLRELKVPDGDAWKVIEPNETQTRQLMTGLNDLAVLTFGEVRPKPQPLADALKSTTVPADPAIFQSMVEMGIKQTGNAGEPIHFLSTSGQIMVRTEARVNVTLHIGNITGSAQAGAKLSRMMMVFATVNNDELAKPELPKNADESPLTEEQQKAYQRELDAWLANMKAAEQFASELNLLHAPWYYALNDEVYSRLIPELSDLPIATPPATTNVTPESSDQK